MHSLSTCHSFYYLFSLVRASWKEPKLEKFTNLAKAYSPTEVTHSPGRNSAFPQGDLAHSPCVWQLAPQAQQLPTKGILSHSRGLTYWLIYSMRLQTGPLAMCSITGTAQRNRMSLPLRLHTSGSTKCLVLQGKETIYEVPEMECKPQGSPKCVQFIFATKNQQGQMWPLQSVLSVLS